MRPYYDHAGIQIYLGDCREVMATRGALDVEYNRFTVITDPPYGTGWIGGGQSDGGFHAQHERPEWDKWTTDWLRLINGAAACAVFCPDPGIADLATHFGKIRLRYYLKTNPRPSLNGNDAPSIEPIVIWPRVRFSDGPSHRAAFNGDAEHPCQKPLSIMKWLVEDVAAPGETILDPFMGSGTTLRAAKDLGRKAIGIDIDERCCEMSARLLQQEVFAFP
jgi:site-specific DNA-methyltransferase (adenine-specific)